MASASRKALISALEWHIDSGADEAVANEPVDKRRAARPLEPASTAPDAKDARRADTGRAADDSPPHMALGSAEAKAESLELARQAHSLDELRKAIAGFEGLAIKKTATSMVFSDGNPNALVMLIGEAPGADEDSEGKPFAGPSGQLLDRILGTAGLDRTAGDPANAVYLTNILNWRPPGNRSPLSAEIEVSLPFIERHIALVKPRILIFAGAVAAKSLLGSGEGISALRGSWHSYKPLNESLSDLEPIPALATYHPAYLLRTPAQKKAVWQDMLMLRQKLNTLLP